MTVYSLSFHADYRCRHSGQCCTADWDVPVEVPIYRSLVEAVQAGRLRAAQDLPAEAGSYEGEAEAGSYEREAEAGSYEREAQAGSYEREAQAGSYEREAEAGSCEGRGDRLARAGSHERLFITEPDLPENMGAMLERTAHGDCVFFDRGSHLCVVHRDLGEAALPSTCRHFPRLAVRDARGTFITLSHYCPTAASMLFRDDCPVQIVASPPAFPPAEYEGLVVGRDEWPPLLNPRRLTDLEGYSAWERHMVARCADVSIAPESVLASVARDATLIRQWRPGETSLADAVSLLPREVVAAAPHASLDASLTLYQEALRAVPEDLMPEPDEHELRQVFAESVAPAWRLFHAPLNRYIAAKSFATWTAYQGRGVATIVRGLECALALVRVEAARQCRHARRPLDADLLLEAFRAADFILNHLAGGDELATLWSAAEEQALGSRL